MPEQDYRSAPPVMRPAPPVYRVETRGSITRTIATVFGILFIIFVSFALGFSAGLNKARFSYQWGEQYEENFVKAVVEESGEKALEKIDGQAFRSGYCAAGKIIAVTDDTIILQGPNGRENTISVSDATSIKKGGSEITLSELKVGNRIVVVGKPTANGTLQANLIRVFNPNAKGPLGGLFR